MSADAYLPLANVSKDAYPPPANVRCLGAMIADANRQSNGNGVVLELNSTVAAKADRVVVGDADRRPWQIHAVGNDHATVIGRVIVRCPRCVFKRIRFRMPVGDGASSQSDAAVLCVQSGYVRLEDCIIEAGGVWIADVGADVSLVRCIIHSSPTHGVCVGTQAPCVTTLEARCHCDDKRAWHLLTALCEQRELSLRKLVSSRRRPRCDAELECRRVGYRLMEGTSRLLMRGDADFVLAINTSEHTHDCFYVTYFNDTISQWWLSMGYAAESSHDHDPMWSKGTGHPTKVCIVDSQISGNVQNGVCVAHAAKGRILLTMIGSYVGRNGWAGVCVTPEIGTPCVTVDRSRGCCQHSYALQMYSCAVEGNGYAGAIVSGYADICICNTNLTKNGGSGIALFTSRDSSMALNDCHIQHNSRHGVSHAADVHVDVKNCSISSNGFM